MLPDCGRSANVYRVRLAYRADTIGSVDRAGDLWWQVELDGNVVP